MRVAVVYEYSGRVRDAFIRAGHDAVSCDLRQSESLLGVHYQEDAFDFIGSSRGAFLDLLICHPPCTYLTNSGVRWLKDNHERQELRRRAVETCKWLMSLHVPMIALENPIGHLSTAMRRPDQIIQPWQFGHGETKATCLWLKNLPKLVPTDVVDGREPRVHRMSPGPDREKERSRTYLGIAQAMADQWGRLRSTT